MTGGLGGEGRAVTPGVASYAALGVVLIVLIVIFAP